nr:MAG TPA: hypothetical protein [Caudoviricetes sp.]
MSTMATWSVETALMLQPSEDGLMSTYLLCGATRALTSRSTFLGRITSHSPTPDISVLIYIVTLRGRAERRTGSDADG